MHTTWSKRVWWALIAVLLCAGTAGAQDFMIGDSTGLTQDFCPCTNELWGGFDTNAVLVFAYTASAGDRVTSVNSNCSTATTAQVNIALYTYNATTDSLMVKIAEDSVTATSTWGIRTKTVSWDLTGGTTYAVARLVKGTGVDFMGSRAGVSHGYWKAGTSFPDPYGAKGTTTNWREATFLLGSNFAGGAAALTIGPTKIGVTKLAPNQ